MTPTDDGQAIECSILFVDLVDSSRLASSVGLDRYAQIIKAFEQLCISQCEYFFSKVHHGIYQAGRDYHFTFAGDELVVFLHSGRTSDDVYQLVMLAIALKCGWLGVTENARRLSQRLPSIDLAAGIHAGQIWLERRERPHHYGYAINLAKRVESASRRGNHYRIFISDAAFKRIVRRMRNLVVGPRRIVQLKGISSSIGVHEIIDSFANPASRLLDEYLEGFRKVCRGAMQADTFDLWVHSCLQIIEEKIAGGIDDDRLELCNQTLTIAPSNPVALYFAAEAHAQREQYEQALLYLADLTRRWPALADGWLGYGEALTKLGRADAAAHAFTQASRYGIPDDEIRPLREAT